MTHLQTDTDGPLAGIRVVDLTTVVMGPLATRILGDLGADVVKVEEPNGDVVRHFSPSRGAAMSGMFLNLNRNKRSVVLDLRLPTAHVAFLELIATSDVFVTNLRSRALRSMNVTYEDLSQVRQDLVYCVGRGYGSTGPYADKAAYDDVIQASSGLASLFEKVGGEPAYVPALVADKVAALHIVYSVLAALFRRAMTGHGDLVEVPMAETMASFNLVEHLHGQTFDPPLGPFGYGRLTSSSRRPRRSADGWVCVLPYTDANWQAFFSLTGRAGLIDDPRFATVNARVENVAALNGLMDEIIAERTTTEWMNMCDEASIPAAPIVDLEHVRVDPHFEAVDLLTTDQHPTEGPYHLVKDPVSFAAGSGGLRRHAPGLGEHTAEILTELGYDDEAVRAIVDGAPRPTPAPTPPR